VNTDGKLADAGDLQLTTSGQLSAHGQTLAGVTSAPAVRAWM
jgi:filamentous hemagglutinin